MELTQIKHALQTGILHTPCYIFDEEVLLSHIEKIKKIAGDGVDFCYAMKANPYIIEKISKEIAKIEVCSPGELELCKLHGISGKSIIFSGVNKTKEDVKNAFLAGVEVITIESEKHFFMVEEYCREHQCSMKILLRLTSGAQFGMDEAIVKRIVKDREHYPYLTIQGIHFFSGTQKKKTEKCIEELKNLQLFYELLKKEYGYEGEVLEYGAGLAVSYFEGEDEKKPYHDLMTVVDYIEEAKLSYRVVLELGRFFTFSCGQYLTTIEDIKVNDGRTYCIVDGGIHHLNYYGQNMAMRVPEIKKIDAKQDVSVLKENHCNELKECCICGSLCTFADVLVRKADLCNPNMGDVLIFGNAGAYSVTEAPFLFLSRKMPDIYWWKKEQELALLREGIQSYQLNK